MLSELFFCSLAWIYGALSLLFAFREVPPRLRYFFPLKVPLLAGLLILFLPEEHHVKAARLTIGSFFLLGAVIGVARALFNFLAYGIT